MANAMTPSATLELALNETGTRADKKSIFYKICINYMGKTWFVSYKYNDFSALNEKLRVQYPYMSIKFPKPKGLFQSSNDARFLEKRRQGLEAFVQHIIADQKLFSSTAVREFMQFDEVENGLNENGDDVDKTLLDDTPAIAEEEKMNLGPSENKRARPSDFEYLKTIGKGSFGKVYLAVHKQEGKAYAVKVLAKSHIRKRNEVRHIMSERNVLVKNIKHPFLVGLHYSFQTKDKLYFVLDYLNGGELFFHLQREKRFPENRARFYAAEIASALGYLHSLNIIYRDLKPENLLLSDEGHLIITDFGLCKEGMKGNETTTTFCGTPEYLAPEVVLKQAYDKTVDWWCLGSVLYEMLFGLPPFYSRDHKEMYERIVNQPLRVSNVISQNAREILHLMLHKDRHKRLGAKRDVQELIEHPFFSSLDFDALLKKKIPPPYVPKTENSKDTKYVDSEFLKEPVSESVGRSYDPSSSYRGPDGEFKGFTFVPKAQLAGIAE